MSRRQAGNWPATTEDKFLMKIVKRLPKTSERLHQELTAGGWIPLKEPESLAGAMILSIPFMAANFFISIMAIRSFTSISLDEFGFTPDSFSITINLGAIIALIAFVIFHELLHLIFIPNFLRSSKTFAGITWYGGFVVTEEEISKLRYILITIAPFFVGSIVLPIILGMFGLLTTTIKIFVLLNAMASSVDVLNLCIVIMQVPQQALLKNNGAKTYWKAI